MLSVKNKIQAARLCWEAYEELLENTKTEHSSLGREDLLGVISSVSSEIEAADLLPETERSFLILLISTAIQYIIDNHKED